MFTPEDKHKIAAAVENILLLIHHDEMPTEKPAFQLKVYGKSNMSWAVIIPNWLLRETVDGMVEAIEGEGD